MEKQLLKDFAIEVAKYEFKELVNMLNGMSFIDAYNKLKGSNLEMDKMICSNGELIAFQVWFEYRYKHLKGIIFHDNEGCELHEIVSVIDNDRIVLEDLDMEMELYEE